MFDFTVTPGWAFVAGFASAIVFVMWALGPWETKTRTCRDDYEEQNREVEDAAANSRQGQ